MSAFSLHTVLLTSLCSPDSEPSLTSLNSLCVQGSVMRNDGLTVVVIDRNRCEDANTILSGTSCNKNKNSYTIWESVSKQCMLTSYPILG